LATAQAKGEYILLLNPDMRVSVDSFEKMLTFMRSKPSAAIASCRLIDEQGNNIAHVRRFPRLLDQALIILKIPHLFPHVVDSYLCADFNYDQSAAVDSVRGSFLMIAPRLIKPFLDERYFVWFEEVDLCRQAIEQGQEVWYNSEATCLDYVGASFRQVGRLQTQDYFADSMIKYFSKWQAPWQAYILKILWPIGKLLARLLGRLKK
jgi:GT2 family glycosyltransferase